MSAALFTRCTACGTEYFPPRLACRVCGGDRFDAFDPGPGVVEQVTELPGGLRIASVRARGVLVVGSSPDALAAGAVVTLSGSPPTPSASTPDEPARVHLPGSAHIENEGTP